MAKKSKKSKKTKKLPRQLLFIPSSDKNFIEQWDDLGISKSGLPNRDPLNFPKSFRICLIGPVGVGKTMFIKNIICRIQNSRKKFERIFVLHQDKFAREYDDIDAEVITELPENDFWMGYPQDTDEEEIDEEEEDETVERPPTLMIIDDICFKDLPKSQTLLLDRLCGFISSHCNVSLAVLNQTAFAIDPIIRKCANIWCIWRPNDTDELNIISRRVGFKSKELNQLFDDVATKDTDSIMVDKTPGSPFPLRLNGYKLIKRKA